MAEQEKKRTRRKATAKKAEQAVEVQTEEVKIEAKKTEEPEVKAPEKNEELELLKKQVELLRQQNDELKENASKAPQVIQISNDTELIDFLWLAPVSDENELLIADGMLGKITGKVGNFSVPKKDLSRMLDSAMRRYIDNRWLIVLGGMSDTERVQYGVDYKLGEVLTKDVFMRLFDYGKEIVPIYKELCDASKDVVAKLYFEAWNTPQRKTRVARETVVAMHKISPRTALKAIIDDMNRAEAE